MLERATLQQQGGKLICTLLTEGGQELTFGLASDPGLDFRRNAKADNTHVDLTITVRVSDLVTLTNQPELI